MVLAPSQVAADQEEAEKVKRNVSQEEAEVKKMQEQIQVVADDAKADLEEAMPALNAAIDSLKALNKVGGGGGGGVDAGAFRWAVGVGTVGAFAGAAAQGVQGTPGC